MMLSLLICAYITGSFSSRAIERNTYDSLACMYICCGEHPDRSTISDFRNRFAPIAASLFTQVSEIAKDLDLLDLSPVYQDGTKIKANASKHHAGSCLRANKIKARLEKEVQELMMTAENASAASADSKPAIILFRRR
jgi:hypothetical protein